MPRPAPASRDSAPGYTLLLWVDLATGRHNGSETVFVPLVLAQAVNAARRELYDNRTRADAWERACAIQIPPSHSRTRWISTRRKGPPGCAPLASG